MDQKRYENILAGIFLSCKNNKINPSDDILVDCATRIYNSESINPFSIKEDKPKDEPATQKQIDYLCRINKNFNAEGLTKKEAHALIKADKENK